MNLFYLSFFMITALSFDLRKKYSRDLKWFLFFVISIIFLANIVLMKNMPDMKEYQKIYETYQSTGKIDGHVEYGYMLLNRFFADLFIPFYLFRCLVILFSCVLFFKGIMELSECFSISSLFFYTCIFVYSYLIQIRTGLGLSVFIGIGIPAFCRKKYLLLILSILIAMTFHISMVALFLPFVLCKLPNTKKFKMIISLFVLFFLFVNVFDIFIGIVERFFLHTKLVAYINRSGSLSAGISVRDFMNFILCMFFSRCTEEKEIDNFMFWSFFCGYALKIIFRNFFEIGVRFNLLFSYSLIFLMPLLSRLKNKYVIPFIYFFAFINFKQWISAGDIIKNGYL